MSLAMRPNEVNTKVQYDCKVRHQAVIFLYAEVLNMRKNLTEIVFILDRRFRQDLCANLFAGSG